MINIIKFYRDYLDNNKITIRINDKKIINYMINLFYLQ